MPDYQAIYDAVRSRILNGDVGRAVSEVARQSFDISYILPHALQAIQIYQYETTRPSVLFRPEVTIDGNMYSVLYGADLMQGCAGFGDSLAEAMADFDKNWCQKLSETGLRETERKITEEDAREEKLNSGQFGLGA
ncbi:MAG: hypothetical protein J3T61_00025 [Candidatus Brocadiales bacterium]|nr:hypothetical protein [Candidatus Bathyanammoxibius sp.]